MASVCRIIPKVKNKNGELVDSQLYQDLGLFISDTDVRGQLWSVAHSKEFMDTHSDLNTDNNGEVTVEDLLGKTDALSLVSNGSLVSGLNELHSFRQTEASVDGVMTMAKQANEINEKSPLKESVTAIVTNENGRSKVTFTTKTDESTRASENMIKGVTLESKMRSWLEKNGIAVDYLTEAEESAGIDGVTDFSAIRNATSGLSSIIRIARGVRGEMALTEEGSHLAIGAVMGRDANVDRALNILRNNEEIAKEVLGDEYEAYYQRYNGNKEKIAHEAAGHILLNQLRGQFAADEMKTAGRYKSLWSRMKDAILNFFKRFTSSELDRMHKEAELSLQTVARRILDDSFYVTPDFSEEAKALGQLFALSKEQQESLDDKSKRLVAYMRSQMKQIPSWVRQSALQRSNGLNEGYYSTLKDNSLLMAEYTKKHKSLLAIDLYLQATSEDLAYQLKSFVDRYDKAKSTEGQAYIINHINDLCKSNAHVIADITEMMEDLKKNASTNEEKQSIDRIEKYLYGYTNQTTGETIPGMNELIARCRGKVTKFMMPTFLSYVKKFIPIDNIIVPEGGKAYGTKGGGMVTLEQQILSSEDVGALDHWLLGASLSNNFAIQSFQRMLTIHRLKIRNEAIEYKKRLQELTLKLEEAGYHNQEFMFERDKEDKLTGYYIKNDSDEYKALSKEQKEYHDAVMEIKNELDRMLPSNMRRLLNAVKIRKDTLEHLQSDKTLGQVVKEKWHDAWNITSDDEYSLEKDLAMVDYVGNEIRVIPIRFLQFAPGEDPQNMSTDIANTLSRYAEMCCNYSIMSRIMPVMELGRTLMANGRSTKTMIKVDKDGVEQEIVSSKIRGEDVGNNTLDRLNDILESELYGFKMEHVETTVLGEKVSVTAIGQRLLALTAASQYMLSPAAAIQNDITAQLQAALSASQKKYFNKDDLMWAHRTFSTHVMDCFADIGSRYPASKIALFSELMNVMQKTDYNPFNQKGLERFSGSDLYGLTTSTEFHANMVLALALAHRTKLKAKDGTEVNFWDALEIVDMETKAKRNVKELRRDGRNKEADALEDKIAKHPEWKNSENKYLVLMEGVTKADGSEFSFRSKDTVTDLEKLTRKSMHISHMLNGIYNSEDAAKWQRYIAGSMLGMYRKWIAPMWYRRVNGLGYSLDEEEWTEGYYRTLSRVAMYRAKALVDKEYAQKIKGKELAEWEKKNMRNALWEIGMFVALSATAALLRANKKKHRSFAYNTLYYFTARTVSELGSMTPVAAPRETMRILQSPSAVLPTANNILGLAEAVVNPTTWGLTDDAYIKSGKYKGLTKLERAAIKAPFLPGVKQWISFLNPEDAVKFYE